MLYAIDKNFMMVALNVTTIENRAYCDVYDIIVIDNDNIAVGDSRLGRFQVDFDDYKNLETILADCVMRESYYKTISKTEDCFDKNGNFIISNYDPYQGVHRGIDEKLHNILFDKDGFATKGDDVYNLIKENGWGVHTDAVKYYYAHECIDPNCKGNYTAIYAWRH